MSGERLDLYVSEREQITRSAAQKLIESGLVTVNGAASAKNYRLREGDEVEVEYPEPVPDDALPEDIPIEAVYEDSELILVNKPKGMVVHPAPGHPDGTLVNALLHHCGASLSGINGQLRPGIVHRIDRDTSGLIIAAKNDKAHVALADQLQDHSLARVYEAVVHGNIREDEGTVDAPIGRHPIDRKKMAIDRKDGRRAVTHWTVLGRYPGYTHIQCRLETGRTHQIRVHMASIGHPLVGDPVYGGNRKSLPGLVGQCLHARKLRFIHPTTQSPLEVECSLPDWFERVLRQINK